MTESIQGGPITKILHYWWDNVRGEARRVCQSEPLPVQLQAGGVAQAVESEPILGAAADVHAPAANTAAVVTYAADATPRSHIITGIAWSYYGGIPVGGNLQVTDGATVIFNIDIHEEGPGAIEFPRPKKGANNTAMAITLAAGGAGVTGKLSILNHEAV